MPFGIRPSNVRVCHSTTRALTNEQGPMNGKWRRRARKRFCHSCWRGDAGYWIVDARCLLAENVALLSSIENQASSFEQEHDHEHERRMDQNRSAYSHAR